MIPTNKHRVFLFLQGPHGPFFWRLSRLLVASGATTWRVGFNQADRVFWPDGKSYIPQTAALAGWPETLATLLTQKEVTDIVVYGDTRPIHAAAIAVARARGLTVHVFEEGYLRPHWVTYERGGANGNSPLMHRTVAEMQSALEGQDMDHREAPARWGALRQHIFYGALYHGIVLAANHRYRAVTPHRALTVRQEFWLYTKRLALMPLHWLDRVAATLRIQRGAYPYHLALLQLEHDASFRDHGPFASQTDFLHEVIAGFANGAPDHHHLVFKAHPLEDGRVPLRSNIRKIALAQNIADRVHFVRGGKLAPLLDNARSVVTVNSTAAQQALWRGLPLKCFGAAVYDKPDFVSDQSLADFFAGPHPPDTAAYRVFRHYLLLTSQFLGSFYAARGRQLVLRHVVDRMLTDEDGYSALEPQVDAMTRARPQHIRMVT